jgi:molybdopterin converting factor small subunit
MRVTVRLFARVRDLAGAGEFVRDVPAGATMLDVWNGLVADYPALAPHTASISGARNLEYVPMSAPVAEGDEVAFLPPVSGG